MRCGFCGTDLDSRDGRDDLDNGAAGRCGGCGSFGRCRKVRCPRCGYENPEELAFIGTLRRWFAALSQRSKAHGAGRKS